MINQISTTKAPAAIGPYSQGIVAEGKKMLFISGQLPINSETGEFAGDCIKCQTKQSLENLKAILEEKGASLANVVKTTVFLSDMNQFAGMNEVYMSYFAAPYPARSAVEVAKLPKEAMVEIEAIAIV